MKDVCVPDYPNMVWELQDELKEVRQKLGRAVAVIEAQKAFDSQDSRDGSTRHWRTLLDAKAAYESVAGEEKE